VGHVFENIDGHLERWIASQSLFFVGTAPLEADGHVNISPKGPIDSLRVLDPRTVAYLDIVGSGAGGMPNRLSRDLVRHACPGSSVARSSSVQLSLLGLTA
jgi:hypothetical protein